MKAEQIKNDTPKAFKKLKKWLDAESKDILQFEMMMILKNDRDLYDFFDEMGIYMNAFMDENPETGSKYWDWQVYVDGECFGSSEVEEPTRKEAETEAFKRAFFILEKRIHCTEIEGIILKEIQDKTLHQINISLTYRSAIGAHQMANIDWKKINKAIIKRWSKSGLLRVKKMAWKQ